MKFEGKDKLTKLGLLMTRKGLHKTGEKAQENAWIKERKMLVCLKDEHLIRMLELKENGDEPWKIIDAGIRELLSSIS